MTEKLYMLGIEKVLLMMKKYGVALKLKKKL